MTVLSNSSNSTMLVHSVVDYLEIAALSSMIIIGVSVNIWAFYLLTRNQCKDVCVRKKAYCFLASCVDCNKKKDSAGSRFRKLKIHLIIANLLVLCVYGVCELAWLNTNTFLGGDFLCRATSYLSAFSFYATSNLVVAIGLDRLYAATRIDQLHTGKNFLFKCIRMSPMFAWALAAIGAVPQVFVWSVFKVGDNSDVQQCATRWEIEKFLISTQMSHKEYEDVVFYERVYEGFHLALVFWIPAVLIAGTYALIVCKFEKSISRVNSDLIRREEEIPMTPTVRRLASSVLLPSFATVYTKELDTNEDSLCLQSPRSYSCTTRAHPISPLPRYHSDTIVVANKNRSEVFTFDDTHKYKISTTSIAVNTLMRAKKRTLKISILILLLYIACWLPYNALSLWRFLYPGTVNDYLELLSHLVVFNAVINPFVYGVSR